MALAVCLWVRGRINALGKTKNFLDYGGLAIVAMNFLAKRWLRYLIVRNMLVIGLFSSNL